MNKNYISLELHKILQMLSDLAVSEECKKNCLRIKPSDDYYEVCGEVQKTDEAFVLSARFGTPNFKALLNPQPALERADTGAMLSLKELLDIKDILSETRDVQKWYEETETVTTSLDNLFSCLLTDKAFEERLACSILSETELADDASPELLSIRRKIITKEGLVRKRLSKIVKSSETQKYLQDNIITMRDGRYVVPVKSEYKDNISGLVHDTSASGATFFVEPMSVVEINNDIRVLQSREQAEIERIIRKLSALCAERKTLIESNYSALMSLELLFSKSNLACRLEASKPAITNDGYINLIKARHPLISKDSIVPIDITLGNENNALIITGPNTGGKTVALKTTGLLVLMTMCGLLIPASPQSSVSVFKNVLVDIGDEQSIEQNLSTFSSHMNNIISIINRANPDSLIMLDEVGSGTDPIEGAALAVSIVSYLKNLGCKILATTHYQEMKIYATSEKGVINASCEFDVETLRPTYKLIIGVPGKSNAFAISKKLGLPDYIISEAEKLIDEENNRFEQVINQLEATRKDYENLRDTAEKDRIESEKIRKELASALKEAEKEKSRAMESAKKQAEMIIDSVKAKSNALIENLEQLRKEKDKKDFSEREKAAKGYLKGEIDKLYDISNPVIKQTQAYTLPRKLVVGDTVTMHNSKDKGTVLTPPDSKGNLQVQFGIIKAKVNISELRLSENSKVTYNKGKISKTRVTGKTEREIRQELDIRGMTVEEGLMEVDRFIDQCVLSGISLLTIIHGKGTGALRSAVHQYLKHHKSVRTYRLGVYGEGENGVTIVDLK